MIEIEKTLKNIFTSEGRLNRLRYVKYILILALFFGIIGVILDLLVTAVAGKESFLMTVVNAVLSIAVGFGSAMLQIRRLHDMDKSGWFVLLSAVPGINCLFGIYLLLVKGTDGTNRYGYDPLLMD